MKRCFILKCCIILLLLSCSSNEKTSSGFEYHIDKHHVIDIIHSSQLLESYEYIALEKRNDAIIGNVDKLKVFDEKLFILSENQVFVYDFYGKFLFKIDRSGRGPGEYLKINNISLDSNILYIYDNAQYRILLFNADDGRYLNTHTALHSVKDIQFVDDYFFADRSVIPNKYVEGNERLIMGKKEAQENIASLFSVNSTQTSNNYRLESYDKQVFWIDPLYNKIYL